jgi:putative flippase GtrA
MAYGHAAAQLAQRPGAAVLNLAPERLVDDGLKRNASQFVKFAVVGGIGTVVNLVVLKATLLVWGHFHAATPFSVEAFASGLAFAVAVVNNYVLNRLWTFRSSGAKGAEFAKFLIVSLAGLGLNELAFWVLRQQIGASVLVSQMVAILCVLPFNFVLNKLWSFKGA